MLQIPAWCSSTIQYEQTHSWYFSDKNLFVKQNRTLHSVIHKRFSQWNHDDVIQWKHFAHYWPFVRGMHRSLVNSPYKGQWRGSLMFFFICALNKQLWGRWFRPLCSLWCHCNDMPSTPPWEDPSVPHSWWVLLWSLYHQHTGYGSGHETAAILLPGFAISW